MLSVVTKRRFRSLSPLQKAPTTFSGSETASVRQSVASEHYSESLYWPGEALQNPPLEAAGCWLGNLHEKAVIEAPTPA